MSHCSGNGTLTVHVDADTAEDSLGNPSTTSSESAATEPPTISAVNGTAVSVSGGACSNGQTLVLTIAMSSITDLAGNAGSGTVRIVLPRATKFIFQTVSYRLSGDLNGVAGADSLCANDSQNPHDGSVYKALVSDGNSRIACTTPNCSAGGASENKGWVLLPYVTYTSLPQPYVPEGWSIGTTNAAGILQFPLQTFIGAGGATGLNGDWTSSSNNCGGSTSSSGYVTYGNGTYDSTAIDYSVEACSGYVLTFYCVQQ